MRTLLLLLLAGCISAQPKTVITGSFLYSDGTPVTGTLVIQMTKPSATDICATPVFVVPVSPVRAVINGPISTTWNSLTTSWASTAGTWFGLSVGSISLYPSTCLAASTPSNRTPSVLPTQQAGLGATLVLSGINPNRNYGGTLTLTTGVNPSPNTTIGNMTLYTNNQPYCVLTPSSNTSLSSKIYARFNITNKVTTMTLFSGNANLLSNTVYTWEYACVQPYMVTLYDQSQKILYMTRWAVPNIPAADVTQLGGNQ